MVIRLLLYLVPLLRTSLQSKEDCATRVDVLDGADLVEAVAAYLTDNVVALDAQQCAIECFRLKCDVAYFDTATHKCRFTSDTSPTPRPQCNDLVATETEDGSVDDKVKRFCMRCTGAGVEVNRDSTDSDEVTPLLQVNSQNSAPNSAADLQMIAPQPERPLFGGAQKPTEETPVTPQEVNQQEVPLFSQAKQGGGSVATTAASPQVVDSEEEESLLTPTNARKFQGVSSDSSFGTSQPPTPFFSQIPVGSSNQSAESASALLSSKRPQKPPKFKVAIQYKSAGSTSGAAPSVTEEEVPVFKQENSRKSIGSTADMVTDDDDDTPLLPQRVPQGTMSRPRSGFSQHDVPVFSQGNSHKSVGSTADELPPPDSKQEFPLFGVSRKSIGSTSIGQPEISQEGVSVPSEAASRKSVGSTTGGHGLQGFVMPQMNRQKDVAGPNRPLPVVNRPAPGFQPRRAMDLAGPQKPRIFMQHTFPKVGRRYHQGCIPYFSASDTVHLKHPFLGLVTTQYPSPPF
ncbi:unnamed protein product [Heligmosomoides polygyrus]|uniref:Apple domain-containing protein n=1 Tax=Heligmosomoides polygyrus TaxID=6339 RepID=A0A183GD27_HELPZ|nr:unnamed protein product [Heligmosomoides polygyrus]